MQEEKWAARDKEEVLHEYGMSQYVYDTSKIDAYDEQHAQEYEDAGSDLEDTGVYDNRPSLDFGDKHRFIHPIKDRPKVQLDVDDESEFDDSDLFSDSDSDNECDAVYSIRGAGGADSAEEYRSAQLKSGADAATVEAVIAAIDEARALINNPQLYDFNEEGSTPAQAQVQHQFDALVEKLERLSTIAEERGMEQQSVGDAIYLMELVSYKVHLLSYGASAATADAIATAIEEAEDFIETLKNGDSDDYSDRTMADLLARLTGALEELKDLDVDISRPNFLIGDLQHWQDYEVEIRNGADRNTLNLVNRVTNKVDPLLDKIRNCEFYVKKEELSCQLQRLHSRLQRLRTKAEKKNIETEVLDQKISKIDSYFNESQDKEEEDFEEYEEESGDEESKKNVLLADIAAAHEELSSQEVKSTSVKVELARLESLSALITAGAEDIDEESARLRAKLEALRDAAVSERSVLARHNADVSVIDAEVAHLNNCIGNVHSMLSDSLPGASTTSDDDYYEDDGDEDDYDYNEYTGAPVQLEMRMLAKLEKLTAQRAAIDAKKPGRKRSRGRKSEEQK